MRNTLIGFAAGVVLTSFIFVLLLMGSPPVLTSGPQLKSDSDARSGTGAPSATDSLSPGMIGERVEQASEQSASPAIADTYRVNSRPERARLQEQWEKARRVAQEASDASSEALRVLAEYDRARLMEKPIITHLPLTAEFDWIASPGFSEFKTNHERIQREGRDLQWAAAAEQQLWHFLNDRQDFLKTYGTPAVTCAETLCELTLVSYGVAAQAAYADFNSLRLELISNPTYKGTFNRNPQWTERVEGGVAALFVILRRSEN